ncbi:MAG: two-component sensor histidine kinase [Mesorhizobium amorphae]|nr:MAG: two-component sensor histidine kinase [Mesorhizobium amorphae]
MPPPDRPQPEAFLPEANREGRGRLKIFLGAAPGVGKTFSMLEEAAVRHRAGTDVVVALAETHGRAETAALLAPLEQLPRRVMPYRGQALSELDLDALLARAPALALIDELAHTNVPGSRHVKRWQDVEEVLAAGIDVLSTLNVQHIESLNDVVARITGVRVSETVPDAILARADEIEVIDLPSEELIARLKAGKVYLPANARRALENFFSKGKLTALRELALRTAASRVDAEMRAFMDANAVRGPWPANERIMVCVNEAPASKAAVRAAKRMAERAGLPWVAVTVVTPRHESLSPEARRATADAMQLAELLGAETETLYAVANAAAELIAFARKANAARIVVGRARRRWGLSDLFSGLGRERVFLRLLDAATDFEVTVVSADAASPSSLKRDLPRPSFSLRQALGVAGVTFLATLAAWGIDHLELIPTGSLSVVYLLGVLFTGARFGLWPSIAASLLASLAYNFFFTAPLFTFAISQTDDVVAVAIFLLGALFTGTLASRLKAQVDAMRAAQRRTAALYDFSRKIAPLSARDDVLYAAAFHIAATLDCRSLILMPDETGALEQVQGHPTIEEDLDARALGAARWAFEKNEPAGTGTATLPTSDWLFVPLATSKPLGVLGVQFRDPKRPLDPELKRLLFAVKDQVAVAVERTHLAGDVQALRVKAEGERLRAALLNSLSHDLRTPLVSVIGALSGLNGETIAAEDRRALTEAALTEARRLDRYVQNLLDMTRLEHGALQPRRVPTDLRELVGHARADLRRTFDGRTILTDIPRDMPPVSVDPALIGQALVNVLDNAAKYSPPDTPLVIEARVAGTNAVLSVSDGGPGIPEHERALVFDPFFRVGRGDRGPAGTGLGLAVVRGFVEAHGGTAEAGPSEGGGTRIALTLPLATEQDATSR